MTEAQGPTDRTLRQRLAAMSPEKRLLLSRRLSADGRAAEVGQEPIAVIGLGCRFPGGASDPERYWQMLIDGVDGIVEVPPDRWAIDDYYDSDPEAPGKMSARAAGFLGDVSGFDAPFFDIDPAEAMAMDPQQRLLMEVTWEAIEHGGIDRNTLARGLTGVFVGIISHDYAYLAMADEQRINAWSGTGSSHAVAAGRISHWLDLRGPSLAIDTACSASLVAVHQACRSLLAGDCRTALAGGVSLMLSPLTSIAATKLSKSVLAADGRCRAFDSAASGMARGEGCGMVVLKRLRDALADGDRISCLLRATAVNHDGRSAGLTAPNAAAQQEVMQRALAVAALEPETVCYLEAHGTGTALGDPIEAQALKAVYGTPTEDGGPCLLGSAKTNFGHLEGAAGIAGLIKAALCVERGVVPPHLHFSQLSPAIDFDGTRFEIPTQARPWTPPGRRYAGVSSFGWAGTNAHAIVEQPPEAPPATVFEGPVALPLSAKSVAALSAYRDRLIATLEQAQKQQASLYDIAWTSSARRWHHAVRECVVGASAAELIEQLRGKLTPSGRRRPLVMVIEPALIGARPDAWTTMIDSALLPEPSPDAAPWGVHDWVRLWEGLGVRLAALYGKGPASDATREVATALGIAWRPPSDQDAALIVGATPAAEAAVNVIGTPPPSSLEASSESRHALLAALAQLYRGGSDVRWDRLRPLGRCVSLPGYPWQRRRCWIDQPVGPAPSCAAIARQLEQHAGVRKAQVRESAAADGARLARIQPSWQGAPGPTAMLPNGLEVTYQSAAELEHFYEDIFEKRVYAKHGISLQAGDCVFDVGGNIGLTSLFCHFEAKDIQLWTFEPAPRLFRLLEANLARHGASAQLFNCGISNRETTAEFTFYPQSSGMSSFYADEEEERDAMRAILRSRQRRGVEGIDALLAREEEYLDQRFASETFSCRLRPLSAIIEEQRIACIDLLKIDVQKAELDVLEGIEPMYWPRIRQIVIEVHDIGDRLARVTSLLQERGFEVSSEQDDSYEGSALHNLYARRPADADPLAARTRTPAPARQPALSLPDSWPQALAAPLPAHGRPTRWLAMSWLRDLAADDVDGTDDLAALFLSGADADDLAAQAAAAQRALTQQPPAHLSDVARGLQRAPAARLRQLLYTRDAADAVRQLRQLRTNAAELSPVATEPRLGMLISGLGDQQPGMGGDLYRHQPVFRQWLDRAAEILLPMLDLDIRKLVLAQDTPRQATKLDLRQLLGRSKPRAQAPQSDDRLNDIRIAHPLLFAVGHALIKQWASWAVMPAALLGYSLGEYLAATVAGVFAFEDALALVATRAALVHALPQGEMLAVSLSAEALAGELGDGVWLAAINGDDLCVLAGEHDALAPLRTKLLADGVACQPIASSHAFHTPMLQPAAQRLREACAAVPMRAPSVPLISNVSGTWLTAAEATDPDYWSRHLSSPVQLCAGLDTIASSSNALLEIGPGRSMISLALQRAQQRAQPAPRAVASLPGALDNLTDGETMRASRAALWRHGLPAHRQEPPMQRPITWLPRPLAEQPSASKAPATELQRNPLTGWFYAPSYRREAIPPPASRLDTERVVLFAGEAHANALAPRLRAAGADVVIVQPDETADGATRLKPQRWCVRPADAEALATLWSSLRTESSARRLTLLHAWSLLAPPGDVTATLRLGLHSLQAMVRSFPDGLRPSGTPSPAGAATPRLLVVTRAVHEVTGEEPLQAEQAPALAVARCVPQELPELYARAVDLQPELAPEIAAEQLHRELNAGDEAVVAWRGRHRWIREMVQLVPAAAPLPLPPNAVIVITGGLGRVGRLLGRHWAQRGAHVVLTSRRGFAPADQWVALAADDDPAVAARARDLLAMQSIGSVEVRVADACDEMATDKLMSELVRQHGRIDGVVHGAGVVGEASLLPLSHTSIDKTEALLAAKIGGASTMVRLAERHRVPWCALVSSVSSVLGGAGLCSYAAGNLYMDALAQQHSRSSSDTGHTQVRSYGWDLFTPDAVLSTGAGRDLTANAMAPEQATTAFEWSLAATMPPHAVVSVTDLPARSAATTRTAVPQQHQPHEAAKQHAYTAPRNEVEQMLASVWARVMKRERVGIHDNFFELGGHSLIGAQIVAAVEQEMHIVLSLRQLFEHPTVAQLALALVMAMAQEAGEQELQDALAEMEGGDRPEA